MDETAVYFEEARQMTLDFTGGIAKEAEDPLQQKCIWNYGGYGKQDSYGRNDGYNNRDAYGNRNGYGKQDSYGKQDRYGKRDGYGYQDSDEPLESYEARGGYAKPNIYRNNDGYGKRSGYGVRWWVLGRLNTIGRILQLQQYGPNRILSHYTTRSSSYSHFVFPVAVVAC
ncbi:hypothetical protein F444_05192 [Phytophthora nicotianae P1976]|uniref:Uncharacterized protein n=1 Tax=Phytophthora nicotianae P1976 TaxID=1317066 RepID=A0A081AMY1_PHYNI|nr:hypothetical protein F444_05192 [Phytophthora nicotianae P1976]